MFTPEQTDRIKEVQAILLFPLDQPYQFLSTSMLDWNYTAFQTALTISWLIKGRREGQLMEHTEALASISDQLDFHEHATDNLNVIENHLSSLGLDDYKGVSLPNDWPPYDEDNLLDPDSISQQVSDLASTLGNAKPDDMLESFNEAPQTRSPWRSRPGR
ncbi:hypothetical protein ACF8O9_07555 [Stenotrophomonas geniculata]|uniref:hypothetical protein n=1 Tax=Stenotrophomonas TaxID=40323 RepID=UPI00370C8009